MYSSSSRKAISYKDRKAIVSRRVRRIISLLLFFTLYLFFSNFVSTPLKVVSTSMKPLLSPGDRILYSRMLVDRQSRFIQGSNSELSRGDLVIISPPYFRENQIIIDKINPVIRFFTFQKIQLSSYSRYSWETSSLIKRVVAIPGDTIRVTGHRASLKVAGEEHFVSEDQMLKGIYKVNINQYPDDWESGYPLDGSTQEYKLGEKEFFVLGDNRGVGSDSSIWGPLPKERIIGKVFFRYWPFSGFSFL